MKPILIHSLSLVSYSILITLICCSPNKTAPIQKDITKAFFRGDWEDDYKNYVTTFEDASLAGEKREIKDYIEKRITKVKNYGKLECYVDSISHLSSCVIRIFNYQFEYTQHISESEFISHFNSIHTDKKIFLEDDERRIHTLFWKEETTNCFWLLKNSDNSFHIIYLTNDSTIKDDTIPVSSLIDSALHTIQNWTQSRQVSIPFEKNYKTILSYWDKRNSYHVFFPLMWNEEDCENHWECTFKDSSVNTFHSAIFSFLCLAKQKDVLNLGVTFLENYQPRLNLH